MTGRWMWREALLLAGCALAVRILTAWPLHQPGYMDAYYYYETAKSLYQGRGFNEYFIWNYLDASQGLPHPSNLYWMPLSSLLIWPCFAIFGLSYRAAQIPFVLLSALLPVVACRVAVETTGRRRDGIIAGLLAVFSGFYLAFWVSPDAFAPFALAGSLCLLAAYKALSEGRLPWMLLAGALAGLGHLARADGLLLLVTVLVVLCDPSPKRGGAGRLGCLASLLGGYLLVMAPWFYRNWRAAGVILPTAGTKTIFLRSYDDLFSYGLDLSLQSYLAWGAWPILRSKLEATWANTQTAIAVLCLVFLAPFAAVGFWRLRRHLLYRLAFLYGVFLWLAMTFVFTFPGVRGGLFHSGAALLPFIYAASLVGLDHAVSWAARRRRGWDAAVAGRLFAWTLPVLALLVSGFVYHARVLQGSLADPAWNRSARPYTQIAAWLDANASPEEVVMVNNPPAFSYYSGRRSVVVPNADLETTLAVCRRYGATYLVLEPNHPGPLAALYKGDVAHPALTLRLTLDAGAERPTYVYQVGP
jgi:hypothetical protein